LSEDRRMEFRTQVGTVLQQPGLLSNMTVFNNVALPLRYHRGDLDEESIAAEVMKHLTALGIDSLRDRFPSQLTHGEIRCAAIARAMVLGQRILLLDDATGGLDAEMTRRLAQYLATCRLSRPLTILAALRQYSELLEIMDRVVFLRAGRIVAAGRPDEVAVRSEADLRGYLFPDGRTPLVQPSIKRGTL
jgi:ABC-type transporter Mla maintaining outer membrane lipid asymmetry ATPase subunit MlaF